MESSTGIWESGGPYHPLRNNNNNNNNGAASDHDDDSVSVLKHLGYKQELNRNLSAVANFSVTFSIISILTGLTTTFGTGLAFGGPLTMVYGWPIVGFFTLIVGSSMAEICSAYPTSGGLYFWSAKLCGNNWGPFASWLTGWSVISQGLWVALPLSTLISVITTLETKQVQGHAFGNN